jgi:heptosyltransferase-1
VVAVDTGLGHLAAALNRPAVAIYGATNPALSGSFGYHQQHLRSTLACSPCLRKECSYRGEVLTGETRLGSFEVKPACYQSLPPARVFSEIKRLMAQAAIIKTTNSDAGLIRS